MAVKRFRRLMIVAGVGLAAAGSAQAYFTDSGQVLAAVSTAVLRLAEAGTDCGKRPEELTADTLLTFSCRVQNTGTAAVYIRDTVRILINGKAAEPDMIVLEKTGRPAGKTQPGEYAEFTWTLRVKGADLLTGEKTDLCAEAELQAFTQAQGTLGFSSEPLIMKPLDFTGEYALKLPVKERRIRLAGNYTAGNQAHTEVWYRTDTQKTGIGDRMVWQTLDVSGWITIRAGEPLWCRYELIADAGTVRSPIYRIYLENGNIQTEIYDYFTGTRLE